MLHLQFIKNNQQIENRLLMHDNVHDFDLLPTPQFFAYGFQNVTIEVDANLASHQTHKRKIEELGVGQSHGHHHS